MELSRDNLLKSVLLSSAVLGVSVVSGHQRVHADEIKATQEPHQVQVNNVSYYSSKTDSEYNDQHASKIQVVNGVYGADEGAKAQAAADRANEIKAQKEKQAQEAKKKAEEQKKQEEQQKAQAAADAKKKAEEQAKKQEQQKQAQAQAASQANNGGPSDQPAPAASHQQSSGGSANPGAGLSMSEQQAKEWIASRESGGRYNAQNGRYYGRYQLDISYLHGDLSPQNQDNVANNYVKGRYGSWSAAQSFWPSHGWY